MNIAIILGSTRPGRLGERVAKFVMQEGSKLDGAKVTLLDLATYDMPFFNELVPPMSNTARDISPKTQQWLDDIAAADGYVFITPEYNSTFPAVLKNAIDMLSDQAARKPAGIISYAETMFGGNIAGSQLRLLVNKLGMLPLPKSPALPHADTFFDQNGVIVDTSEWAARVKTIIPSFLGEVMWYADALKTARDKAGS
ncbi:MAG: NADPH-dependent FMN reductase [Candidatus Saccharibacteria bacterium]